RSMQNPSVACCPSGWCKRAETALSPVPLPNAGGGGDSTGRRAPPPTVGGGVGERASQLVSRRERPRGLHLHGLLAADQLSVAGLRAQRRHTTGRAYVSLAQLDCHVGS